MKLREYQGDAIARVREEMRCGKRRVLLVMPTGSGKTYTCSEIARITVAQGRRALWLAHRSELIDQAAESLAALGLNVGAICASSSTPPNPYAPVQVASVQTLLARNARPPADMIIPDEAHHYADAAPEFMKVLNDYPNALMVGPTATPERGNGSGMGDTFDALVVGATVRELTEGGYLVPCRVLRPESALGPGEIAMNPVDAYVQAGEGRSCIVFARSVELAEEYAAEFNLRGIKARALSDRTPWSQRREMIDAFRRGTLQVLVNVYVLTEGFDAPEASCCILSRGAGSQGLYIQMVGRILRPCGKCAACLARNRGTGNDPCTTKPDALLIDLRGVSHEHGHPEDDREYSLEGRGIRLRDPNSYCPVCQQIKTPGEPCSYCPYKPSGESRALPDKVVGVELKPYYRVASEKDDDDRRAARLAKWIAYARRMEFKDGWWKAKFHAVFGSWPNAKVTMAAMKIAYPQPERRTA